MRRSFIVVVCAFALLALVRLPTSRALQSPLATSGYLAVVFKAPATPTARPTITATPTTTGTPTIATPTSSTTATTTASPTLTATDDSSDTDPTLDIGPDEDDPIAGQPFVLSGTLTDSNGDGVAGVQVTVTYKVDGGSDSPWCTANTTSPDGDWKCTAVTVSADLKDKHVTWTATIVVNNRTIQETYDETVGES